MKRIAVAMLAITAGLTGCQDNETAVARGDRLWADSSYEAALAEYRLAVAQRGDEEALVRLAHAYVRAGELAEANEAYRELLNRSPDYAEQAAWDYLHVARRALDRGDEFDAAFAVDAALTLRPELRVPDALTTVARFHRQRGDLQEAIGYYERALSSLPPDSAPRILYQIGLLEEEQGRCDRAIDHFRAFRAQAEESPRSWQSLLGEADWHIGSCSFRLAQQARDQGQITSALDHLETMIRLGVPENLLDQAWFDRGEMLYAIGRFDEALAAYRHVLERNPARTGQLVERAQQRIDDIRFRAAPQDTTL